MEFSNWDRVFDTKRVGRGDRIAVYVVGAGTAAIWLLGLINVVLMFWQR